MSLKRSARFGSFNAVTSFMAPLTDFSSERSFTSSVALISLSPGERTQSLGLTSQYFTCISNNGDDGKKKYHNTICVSSCRILTVAAGCNEPQDASI